MPHKKRKGESMAEYIVKFVKVTEQYCSYPLEASSYHDAARQARQMISKDLADVEINFNEEIPEVNIYVEDVEQIITSTEEGETDDEYALKSAGLGTDEDYHDGQTL